MYTDKLITSRKYFKMAAKSGFPFFCWPPCIEWANVTLFILFIGRNKGTKIAKQVLLCSFLFQLKSSEVAFVTVINHIGAFTAIVTSYIGNKTHRPRAIAIGVEIMGIGQFICALPHFLTDPRTSNPLTSSAINSSLIVCGADAPSQSIMTSQQLECDLRGDGAILSNAWLLILGELITGIGSGPVMPLLITYIDDCVGKVKVSVYVGESHINL